MLPITYRLYGIAYGTGIGDCFGKSSKISKKTVKI